MCPFLCISAPPFIYVPSFVCSSHLCIFQPSFVCSTLPSYVPLFLCMFLSSFVCPSLPLYVPLILCMFLSPLFLYMCHSYFVCSTLPLYARIFLLSYIFLSYFPLNPRKPSSLVQVSPLSIASSVRSHPTLLLHPLFLLSSTPSPSLYLVSRVAFIFPPRPHPRPRPRPLSTRALKRPRSGRFALSASDDFKTLTAGKIEKLSAPDA